MNILREPVELGRWRYKQRRAGLARRWLVTSSIYTLGLLLSLLPIALRKSIDVGSMLGGVFGMLIMATVIESIQLLSARYKLTVWQWDAERLNGRGFHGRWTDFYRFKIKPDYPVPGFAGFFVQLRTWGGRPGMWVKIGSCQEEVDAVAQAARQHLPQQVDHAKAA